MEQWNSDGGTVWWNSYYILFGVNAKRQLNACRISWNTSAAPGCTATRHGRRHVGANLQGGETTSIR